MEFPQVLEIPRVNSGFCQKTVAWFKSYLSDRAFKVNINNHFSDLSKTNCDIPQGSILGPLLFLLYFNDMPQAVHSDLLLYADNSSLIFQHKHVHTIEHQLKKDFTNLCELFVENKLSIHGIEIKQYDKVTYLGYLLDETMSGESMALKKQIKN